MKFTPAPLVQDLRFIGTNNHVTQDAGVGSNGTSVGSGSNNIAIGSNVLSASTTGSNAIGIGTNALRSANGLTGTNSPIAIGSNALQNLTSGIYMTAIGYNALGNASNGGNYSVAIGNSALAANNNSWNTAVGANSLLSATGDANSAYGYRTGYSMTAGNSNTYIGASTAVYLKSSLDHNQNTFIGSHVTQSSSDTSPGFDVKYDGVSALGAVSLNKLPATLRAINQSSFFGTNATVASSYTDTALNFGTAIGAQAKVGASNSIVLGRLPNSMVDNNGIPSTNPQDNVGIGTIAPTNALHVKTTADPVKFEGLVADATAANVVVVGSDGILKTVPKSGFAASTVDTTNDAWVNNNSSARVELGTLSDGTTARIAGTEVVATDTGRFGIKTPTPNATLEVKKSSTTPTTSVDGVIPPNITKLELANKVAGTYGANQKSALVYVSDISGTIAGTSASQVADITGKGYYYFDDTIANGTAPNGRWVSLYDPKSIAIPIVEGTPTSAAIDINPWTYRRTPLNLKSSITLGPGRWQVSLGVLLNVTQSNVLNTTSGLWVWPRFSFTDSASGTTTSSDVGINGTKAHLISGSFTSVGAFSAPNTTANWNLKYDYLQGTVVINNTSGADKTYYLIWVNADFNKQPTTVTGTGDALPTFLGLHGSGNGENYLRAMKIQ